MPNNMDLNDIKKRRKESLAMTGDITTNDAKRPRVTYNYNNIFLEEPTDVCEDRVPKTDESIQIEIRNPIDGHSVTTNMGLLFSANSTSREIKNIIVFVDNEQMTNYEYSNKRNITDMQNIDLSSLALGKHTIRVEAIDSK
jgi:hypothetical protein